MSSEFKDAQESPGFLLWQVTNRWEKEIRRALEPFELTHPQFVLLFSCYWLNDKAGRTGITQVQLAQHTQMDVNVTSQVLRTLEARGYVERGAHPTDTRAKVITVTRAGSDLAERAVAAVEAADRVFFAAIEGRQDNLMSMMRQLANRKS